MNEYQKLNQEILELNEGYREINNRYRERIKNWTFAVLILSIISLGFSFYRFFNLNC